MDKLLEEKYDRLKSIIESFPSMLIAFSGGVDSSLLAKVATDSLKEKSLAVTIFSEFIPEDEKKEASSLAVREAFNHRTIEVKVLNIDNVGKNPKNRCYICKKALFLLLKDLAVKEGLAVVADGTNLDDCKDYRPGMKALEELEVLSPLKMAGFTKEDVRALAKALSLDVWDKPSYACLASRFVYDEDITIDKLKMVEAAEKLLFEKGFRQVRVRIHGDNLARIELLPEDMTRFFNDKEQIIKDFKKIAFNYVTLDLQGYRSGSMNENDLTF